VRRLIVILTVAAAVIGVGGAVSADTFTVTLVSQTNSTITLGWAAQPGYGYLFSANGKVVSRTNDPSRTTVKFAKGSSTYEVAVITKGATGTYPSSQPPPSDTTAPSVTMTAPANGATVNGTISVSANATDNVGVAKVEFFRDGNLLGTDTAAPYSVPFDTTSVANGAATFGAKAYDAAGNSAGAPQVAVTVANGSTPPPVGTLLWKPPALTNPTTLNVTNTNHSFSLNNSQDYIVKLPSTPLTVSGGLELIGGRNITIIGGEISRPTSVNDVAASYGIALYRQTGTVHIEGVWIHGVGIGQAVLIAHTDQTSANSIIQIENSRLESLHQVGTIHTDTIQSYGGPAQLRLYQDTFISNGVLIQTQPCDVGNGPAPHNWDYRRLNLVHQTADAYALWKNCTPWSEFHQDIWLKTNPNHVAASSNSAWAGGNCWPCWNPGGSWPITGEQIKLGLRPEGDWVPVGVAGTGYVSPGYQP